MTANDDEDVWLEILSYRDSGHVQEVMKALEGDKMGNELHTEAMKLITPGSMVLGDFSRFEEQS